MTSPYKKDFPIFTAHDALHYLDSAATSQKPKCVIDQMSQYYETTNSSPNRGAHQLSVKTTALYEQARSQVLTFTQANPAHAQAIFTANATAANNLVASGYAMAHLKAGDEILIGIDAHHSIIVPLQVAAKATGAVLKYIAVDASGQYAPLDLTPRTRFVAFPWVSNALGTLHDAAEITKQAHAVGAAVLVDAAQAAGHMPLQFQDADIDFLTFSAHKMFGPQGTGVLVAKTTLLDKMTPMVYGGDMIEYVDQFETTYAPVPKRFEAGTQNVAGVVGLAVAMDYITTAGLEKIATYEQHLTQFALDEMAKLPWIKVVGPSQSIHRGPIIAFEVDGIHPHDLATLLDEHGVAIRAGHHCAQPLMKHLGKTATCRVSMGIYNDSADVEALIHALKYAREVFGLEC